jgi:D-glycero-D-manno-heptose 1,7-bisphosphate phosphatase
MGKIAVFFDRDGVLCQAEVREGKPYPPADAAKTVVIPSAMELLPALKDLGYVLLVVTNQPDVARGTRTKENVLEINDKLASLLPLDGFYVCFHDNRDNCHCRKPKPGLIFEAATRYGLNLSQSWLIGDRASDVEAGLRAGCKTIFLDFEYAELKPARPDFVARDLESAINLILEEE